MGNLDGGSVGFVFFGLLVVLLVNVSRAAAWRLWTLLLASLFFLILLADNPLTLVPIGAFVAVGYFGTIAVRNGSSKVLTLTVMAVIGIYIWLKQYSFLPAAIFLRQFYLQLGISYILFRVLHVLIDARDSELIKRMGPSRYLAYALNFTTFISGPIQRYEDFDRQLESSTRPRLELDAVAAQIERIVIGFFKINVVGLLLNMIHIDSLAEMSRAGGIEVGMWAAFKATGSYPLFLYCNFSGYIDIVIALARLMSIELPENFNRPFSATSFIDFWNRWHITLSAWLKAYVYNPLLLAILRRSRRRSFQNAAGILCSFITFFLIGVWHGRTSEFVVFGLLQGIGIAANKIWQTELSGRLGHHHYRTIASRPLYVAAARGLTFTWFAVSAIWFWANWSQIDVIYLKLGLLGCAGALLCLWVVSAISLALWELMRGTFITLVSSARPQLAVRTIGFTAAAMLSFLMTTVLSQPAPDIVYRTF